MPHIHRIYDTDLHFIIDPITRKITSESGKVSLMQYDHLSERFTFEIPRFIEGHDMSVSDEVQIHYINADKRLSNKDIYVVDDIQLSPDSTDMVIGSWLISQNATSLAGSLSFALRFVCYENDTITYQWFTEPFTGIRITEGIYNVDSMVDEYAIDIVESWKREIIAAFEQSDVYKTTEQYKEEAITSAKAASESEQRIRELMYEFAEACGFTPKGDYDESTVYHVLDIVTHNSVIWLCKAPDISGVEPSLDNIEQWQVLFDIDRITEDMIDAMEPLDVTDVVNALITNDEIDAILGD